jgi:hypothetical protein
LHTVNVNACIVADLSIHARTQSHISNAKIGQETGVATGPISVQICNDEDNCNDEYSHGGGNNADGVEEVDDSEYKPEFEVPTRSKRTPGKNYIKKYRPAWEDEEEFRGIEITKKICECDYFFVYYRMVARVS